MNLRLNSQFNVLGVRHGNISARNTFQRSIKIIKSIRFHNGGGDFSTNVALREGFINSDDATSLLDGGKDGFSIKGAEGAEVDDFSIDTVGGEFFSSSEGETNSLGEGDDTNVSTFTHNLGLVKRESEISGHDLVADFEFGTIHQFVFEEDNRVGVTDGRLQQTTSIFSIIGSDNQQSGNL